LKGPKDAVSRFIGTLRVLAQATTKFIVGFLWIPPSPIPNRLAHVVEPGN